MNQAQKINQIRIVAAVLDTKELLLYRQDGSTFAIPQGDARIRPLLEQVTPEIIRQGHADINLELIQTNNSYREFEEKSNGVVRFFKVAKDRLRSIFGANDSNISLQPTTVGQVPVQPAANDNSAEEVAKMESAVQEIMQHAVPVADAAFDESTVRKQAALVEANDTTPGAHVEETSHDTIIAVVDKKIIPGVEKIKTQFTAAAKTGNTAGIENMLKRLSKVIGQRQHSVDDLLKFLERADLPVADDGSIIIYKVLASRKGAYVDVHSKQVTQRVGSYVCMDPSLVDHDRRNECSNGLHVARRGYISTFPGDVCVLAKLAPEDVIAVPLYDANKMRVCGYHIVAELTSEMYGLLKRNKPITDTPEGARLLAQVMAGNHIGIIEEVRITGQKGTGLQITDLTNQKRPPDAALEPKKEIVPVQALTNPDEMATAAPAVDPKQVVKEVAQVSRKETAKGLYDAFLRASDAAEKATALKALMDYKKSMKVGWDKLGVPNPAEAAVAPVPALAPAKVPVQAAVKAKAPAEAKGQQSPRDQIKHLLPRFDKATGQTKKDLAFDILRIKKQAKKSWEALGVSEKVVAQIKLRTE